MNERNVILTGVPRSGTTLICHLLDKLPDTVALHEPIKLRPRSNERGYEVTCDEIEAFFEQTRKSILATGKAISKHTDGKVPDNPYENHYASGQFRKKKIVRGEICIAKPVSDDFLLCIKHPAAFTALIEFLVRRFPCFAIIRNPLSALASWNSVDEPMSRGHAPAAERFERRLATKLASISDKLDRQVYLLSWYYEKYQTYLSPEAILRYEDIVSSGGKALSVITPQAAILDEFLENKNKNKLYNHELMLALGEKLLRTGGAFWEFYSRQSVELLLQDIEFTSGV
jgi:ribosome-associated protein YbcJ (S4-like RNA binding protein)